ncbi:MAG: phenylacetate--CoA ligase family protein [Candidatus Helarchaeota archaeon]
MSIKNLMKKLPYPIRYYAKYRYRIIPPKIRYGKTFWKTYTFLKESQWWAKEKLEEYQMQQLEKLLNHAYENVPYYRRVFDERRIRPKDIQNFNDLKKVPYLTKEIVRENLADLIAENCPKSKLLHVTTGGSTGIPLEFYLEKGVTDSKERAFILALWERAKYKIGDKRAVLRGKVIQSANNSKFWEYDPADNILFLSSYHMNDAALPNYIKKINDFKPKFLHVYPSSITILARFMKENNIAPFSSVKAVLCSSESLYSWQRNLLEKVFNCRVFSFYGHGEKAVLAGECEKSIYYHIFPEYGLVELIDREGNLICEEGKMGEIVASGFNNYAMPFIRYRTGDIGVYSNQKCYCGRNYPLLKKIEGRLQEFFIDKNGSLVSFIAHHRCLWDVWDKIKAYQYIQNEPGKLILNIEAISKFSISSIERIKKNFFKRYSGFDIEIIFVKNIPRTTSGKFRYLIQNLQIEFKY